MTQKMFALRHIPTGKLLGVDLSFSDDSIYAGTSVRLHHNEDNIWVVKSMYVAEAARTPVKWFNSDYQRPTHNYYYEDLEVVELKLATSGGTV